MACFPHVRCIAGLCHSSPCTSKWNRLSLYYCLLQDRLGEAKVGATVASLGDEVHKQKRDAAAQNANGGVHPHEAIV